MVGTNTNTSLTDTTSQASSVGLTLTSGGISGGGTFPFGGAISQNTLLLGLAVVVLGAGLWLTLKKGK